MKRSVLLAGLASLVLGGAAVAQPGPSVEVALGPAVQARADQLGSSELEAQRQSLRSQVTAALARGGASKDIRSVRLVIQDIQPNRPTSAELGASPGLSASSFGLGGAAITGQVVDADGRVQPVRYRFFAPDLLAETNFDTWGDAQETFGELAGRLGKGIVPAQTGAWPPPREPTPPTGSLIAR